MVSVAVSKTGKTKVHFIDKGTKVDGRCYCETLLQNCLLPDIRQLYGGEFVFQQDGAPSHRAMLTVEFLQQNVPNFIEPFCLAAEQSGHKPRRLCCLGCSAARCEIVNRVWIVGLEDFKDRVRTCCASLNQQLINKGIDQWRPRLKIVVKVHAGHNEQLFS